MNVYKVTVDKFGAKRWYRNGVLDCVDGPAVEYENGGKEWWVNGLHHRIDGPAVEQATGYKEWWVNGKLHREDGPAVEWANGDKAWWLNSASYSEEEFLAKTQPAKELTIADIEKLLGHRVKVVK